MEHHKRLARQRSPTRTPARAAAHTWAGIGLPLLPRVTAADAWSRSSVWSERRPVKAEVAGSSPVGIARGVEQLGSSSVSYAEGRGFESRLRHHVQPVNDGLAFGL